jgi:hypothetical protein
LLAVDAAAPDPLRHVPAAADMTCELGRDSGDHVIVLHVHEFAVGRFGRIQVDCGEGEGEGVVEKVVSDLQAAGVSAEGEIRQARLGHIAADILKAAQEHDARIVVLGSSSRTDLPRIPLAASLPGCCIWPPGRSSSCPEETRPPRRCSPQPLRRRPADETKAMRTRTPLPGAAGILAAPAICG